MYDLSGFVDVLTPQKAIYELTVRLKQRRKEAHLTQVALAEKTGVSYAVIKKFERTGNISLFSLVAICDKLGAIEDINCLLQYPIITSVKDYKL